MTTKNLREEILPRFLAALGAVVDPQGRYTLAMSDFLAAGGDGYAMLAKLPILKQYMPADAALEAYLIDIGTKVFDGIKESRIIILPARRI